MLRLFLQWYWVCCDDKIGDVLWGGSSSLSVNCQCPNLSWALYGHLSLASSLTIVSQVGKLVQSMSAACHQEWWSCPFLSQVPWLVQCLGHTSTPYMYVEGQMSLSKTTSFTKYVPFEPGSPAAALQDMTFQSWEQSALCSHPSWGVCVGKHWLSSLHRALKQTHLWYWAFCPWCPMSNS